MSNGPMNTLDDLSNHLFAQMERLDDDDLSPEELDTEIKRAGAMADISKNIIDNANTVLKATKTYNDIAYVPREHRPRMLQISEGEDK